MSEQRPEFDYYEESASERLARKSKESPLMIIGLVGCAAAVGYGAYSYKKRGSMSTSVFIMQYRVIAQGIFAATLTAGIGYTLVKDHFFKPKDNLLAENEH